MSGTLYNVSVAPVALAVCGSNTTEYVAFDCRVIVSTKPLEPMAWSALPKGS